jgi:hypothetical protein
MAGRVLPSERPEHVIYESKLNIFRNLVKLADVRANNKFQTHWE